MKLCPGFCTCEQEQGNETENKELRIRDGKVNCARARHSSTLWGRFLADHVLVLGGRVTVIGRSGNWSSGFSNRFMQKKSFCHARDGVKFIVATPPWAHGGKLLVILAFVRRMTMDSFRFDDADVFEFCANECVALSVSLAHLCP